MNCRHCGLELRQRVLDLGSAPPSNAYLCAADLDKPETSYPLRLMVCTGCWLVQTEDFARPEQLFADDYAYFSSTSSSWVDHARRYCEDITRRLRLGASSFVLEVAANDGYLLRNFVSAAIPCLGIEPTAGTAAAAEALGVPILRRFFGQALAQELVAGGRRADLIVANNVYAHVPDINDFTAGLKAALAPAGTITLEFPHLMQLLKHTQFDTVYHEHFSYLSLGVVKRLFARCGLRVFDVESLPTHGGSLRVYGCHEDDARAVSRAVEDLLAAEREFGLQSAATYAAFQGRADAVKNAFVRFLLDQKAAGRSIAGYGAAAKGNTLLNYAGIKPDLLPYVCDAAAAKQGHFLPGSRIPVLAPQALDERKPQIVLVLPWNIAAEVASAHARIGAWGGRFVVAVPEVRFLT